MSLTPRERETFEYIKEIVKEERYPTARELSQKLGITKGGAENLINRLKLRGYIKREGRFINNKKMIILKEFENDKD